MKIVIEIPDHVPESRAIFIMAGMHKVGYIEPNTRKVFVQTAGCSMCGRCCQKLECPDLEKEPGDNDMWRCSKAIMRPFLCCISEPKSIPECTVRYEEVH
jgi:TPP-dependent indolepyruvate ferredoxin oxidoreductase alpha subunit